jgi:diadenylate cyclase
VEIALLTVAVYFAWKLFRGTRGAKVMTGLAILVVALWFLSEALKLRVLSSVLSSFSAFFFVALIVLFQPELRRLLAELGSQHLFATQRLQAETIEAVVSALETLQRERMGALIAFEQDMVYHPARETGTELDAQLSEELLVTLFFPRTPLHDGGVIIRKDRVVLAAAIFPLSQAEGLHRTLGLRHRAAMGLSEETDAIVVVLSEETGTISLAAGGKLDRPLTIDQLRAHLTDLLIGKRTS